MTIVSRRSFLQNSALATGAILTNPFAGFAALTAGPTPKLCFSTLGCPAWSFSKILEFANTNGYEAIEIRVIEKETDIRKIGIFQETSIADTVRLMKDHRIKLADLGSSAAMHHTDPVQRKKSFDEAKAYVDLAAKLGCPYIRIFPNNLPSDDTRKKILDLIAAGFTEIGEYAKGSGVMVLMETHGDLVKADELVYVMQQTKSSNTGLIWDIMNAWSVTKEDPAMVYNKLGKYFHHVHVKDGLVVNGKVQYTLTGKGEAPLKAAIAALRKGNYKGYYSFEWEKHWHPEIEEPEIALAQYPIAVKEYFK